MPGSMLLGGALVDSRAGGGGGVVNGGGGGGDGRLVVLALLRWTWLGKLAQTSPAAAPYSQRSSTPGRVVAMPMMTGDHHRMRSNRIYQSLQKWQQYT